EIIAKVMNDPPTPPRAIRPEVPVDLEAICLRAMEKDPAHRYPTAQDMADELQRFLAGEALKGLPTRAERTRRWVRRHRTRFAFPAAAVLVMVGVVVVMRSFAPEAPPDPAEAIRREVAAGKPARLLDANGQPRWAAWPLAPAELTGTPDDGGTCS